MTDPLAAIDALFTPYATAQSAKDLVALGALHWRDEGFTHVWSPGRIDRGWNAYALRLEREFAELGEAVFRFDDLRAAVFEGRFVAVTTRWRCEYRRGEEPRKAIEGAASFTVARMEGSWRIVTDHYSVS